MSLFMPTLMSSPDLWFRVEIFLKEYGVHLGNFAWTNYIRCSNNTTTVWPYYINSNFEPNCSGEPKGVIKMNTLSESRARKTKLFEQTLYKL